MSSESSLPEKQTLEQFLQKNDLFKQKMFGIDRWVYPRVPEDICRLTIKYSKQQTQNILEEAEKGNFFIFAKVRLPHSMDELFIALTPAEITAVRNNSPEKTNIIYGGSKPFFANIFELWVSKINADKFLDLASVESSPTPDKDIQLRNKTRSYRKDTISEAVINHILPTVMPDKKESLSKDKYWLCFLQLPNVLTKDGSVNVTLFKEKNKDKSSITGTDKHGGEIDISYQSFRGRLANLIKAYKIEV